MINVKNITEQKYHALAEISDGTVLDLGYGKIEPEEKHNFATFDQAAYSVKHFCQKRFCKKLFCKNLFYKKL